MIPTIPPNGKLNILAPSGLGDLAWMHSKLHALPNVKYWLPGNEQRRAHQYLELVGAKCEYLDGLKTRDVWDQPGEPRLTDEGCFVVHANAHLEAGKRIESWYPALPFEYQRPVVDFTDSHDEPFVIVFTGPAGYMGGQLRDLDWLKILYKIDASVNVRFLGAGKDVIFQKPFADDHLNHVSPLWNVDIAHAIAAFRNPLCRGCVGVNSGPTILAAIEGVKTFMFYPDHLSLMPGSWENNDALEWSYVREFDPASPFAGQRAARQRMGAVEAVVSGAVGRWLK